MLRQSSTQRIPKTIIGAVCGKRLAGNLKDDIREPGFTRSPVISCYTRFWWFPFIPSDRQSLSTCLATQQISPSKTHFSNGVKKWRLSRKSRPDRWTNCMNMQTIYNRRTSAYGPARRPTGLKTHKALPNLYP